MKNFVKLFGIIALIGLSFLTACDDGNDTSTSTSTFTVTFNGNAATMGTVPPSQTVIAGSSLLLPGGSGLTRTGFTFGGWNTNSSGTGNNYSAFSSFVPSTNITLYAKWEAMPTYTITFDTNGATSGTAPAKQTVTTGYIITLPSNSGFSRTGFNFTGWNTNSTGTGTNYNIGSSYTVMKDVTLYANWMWIPAVSGSYRYVIYPLTIVNNIQIFAYWDFTFNSNGTCSFTEWDSDSSKTTNGTYTVSGNNVSTTIGIGNSSSLFNFIIIDNNKINVSGYTFTRL